MPSLTLNALRPCARRWSTTCRLRPPTAQITKTGWSVGSSATRVGHVVHRHVDGTGHVAGGELVVLAHVEHEGTTGVRGREVVEADLAGVGRLLGGAGLAAYLVHVEVARLLDDVAESLAAAARRPG